MAGFLQSLFGRANKVADEPPEGRDGRTKPVTDVAASHDRVREIPSHEMDSVLSNAQAVEDHDFVTQHEPYLPGQFIGGMHKVVEILGGSGRTGMGVVYVCERYGDGKLFALKTFQDRFLRHSHIRQEFQNEGVNNVRLGWFPHIVTANSVVVLDGRPFIDMLHVPPDSNGRRSLHEHIASRPPGQPFVPELACRLAIEICHGMEHAASLGITPHRDLKPGNVLISGGLFAKVCDFGLARALDADLSAWRETGGMSETIGSVTCVQTKRGVQVVGTLPWMSPEHFDGRTDQRSDVYALGIILFQMACGRYPYQSKDWEYAHREEPAPPFDSPLASIVHRALAKAPDHRYQTFTEMRRDLEEVYRDIAGKAHPSLHNVLQGMGYEQNSLGGWSKPGGVDHLVNMAATYHNLGRDDDAEPLLRQALQTTADSASAHASLALTLRRRGAIKEALAHFQRAAELSPDDPLLLHNMGTTYLLDGNYREALPLLDQALNLDESLPGLWADKALCLERLGGYEAALTTVGYAIEQAPRDPKSWLLKAQILVRKKDGPGALEALQSASRLAATSDVAQLCRELEREAMALVKASDSKRNLPAKGTPGTGGLTPLEFPYTIPLSRKRREQIRSLLLGLKRPTKQITTAELAAAVIRDASGPLPTWAQDPQFERELEILLETDMVWICTNCDGIIGFLDTPSGEPQSRLARDLMLVHCRDQLTCPVCGAKEAMALCNPEVLKYGQRVHINGNLRGMDGPDPR